jgi:hypothetical protein
MTEIWEETCEVEFDDETINKIELQLAQEQFDSHPSEWTGDELRRQVVKRWDMAYARQRNEEWHRRQILNKRRQQKTLLNTVSRGHGRYKRISQSIKEHQIKAEKQQEKAAQEKKSLAIMEGEVRKRLTQIGWQYTYSIDRRVIFQHL